MQHYTITLVMAADGCKVRLFIQRNTQMNLNVKGHIHTRTHEKGVSDQPPLVRRFWCSTVSKAISSKA